MPDPIPPTPTRKGKVASLPKAIRDEVNQRLQDGQAGSQILPWLNALPEVQEVLQRRWEGRQIDDGNLSEWRAGGYRDWLAERRRVENLRGLAEVAQDISRASGGGLAGASADILAGKIFEGLEAMLLEDEEADEDPDSPKKGASKLDQLVDRVTKLRFAELAAQRQKLDERKHGLKTEELKLAREKFETQTAEMFLKWAGTPQARQILDDGGSKDGQVAALRRLFFGDREESE